jgi:hypothetical protein
MQTAALDYATRGWKPVPVSRKTKKPIGRKWQKEPFNARQFKGQWSPVVEFAHGASAARKAFQEQALAAIHTVAQGSVR